MSTKRFTREWETPAPQTVTAYPTPSSSGAYPSLLQDSEYSPTVAKATRKAAGKGRMIWCKEHRQALHLLQAHFQLDWNHCTRVFNQVFEVYILQHLGDKIPVTSLRAQYSPSERKKDCWIKILEETPTAPELAELEQLARDLERVVALTSVGQAPEQDNVQAPGHTIPREAVSPHQRRRQPIQRPASSLVAQRPATLMRLQAIPASLRPEPFEALPEDMAPTRRVQLTEFVKTGYRYVAVTAEKAHPPLPAVLYRVYDRSSNGANDNRGFVAGLFMYNQGATFPDAPACSDPAMFAYTENHINRNPSSSPLISATNSLFWAIREALKRAGRGARPRISIINAEVAHRETKTYYVPPYTSELRNKCVFTNGAQRYRGTYEFLIWSHVSENAILFDMSLSQLQSNVNRLPTLAVAMHLDLIGKERVAKERIRRQLKLAAFPLTVSLTNELAILLLDFGVDASAPSSMITKLVSDFRFGWEIKVEKNSPARWDALAGVFAYALTMNEATDDQVQAVKEAFLSGLRSSMGDFFWEIDSGKTRMMHSRARKVGLEPPLPKAIRSRQGRRPAVEPWVIIESSPASHVGYQQPQVQYQGQEEIYDEDESSVGLNDQGALDETEFSDGFDDEDNGDEDDERDEDMMDDDDNLMTSLAQLTAEDVHYIAQRERARDVGDGDYDEDMSDEE